MSMNMSKEKLLEEFNNKYGKYFKNIRIVDRDGSEIYSETSIFKSKFLVEVEGYPFKDMEISYDSSLLFNPPHTHHIKVISKIEIEMPKLYPISVGYLFDKQLSIFSPLTMNPDIYLEDYEHWIREKAIIEGGIDEFSKFLNKKSNFFTILARDLRFSCYHTFRKFNIAESIIATMIGGTRNIFWGYSAHTIRLYGSLPIEISPNNSKPNTLNIQICQFKKISKIFPSQNFKELFKAYGKIIIFYNEFLSNININEYPHDEYLDGPDAFMCRNCNSMLFIQDIIYENKKSCYWTSGIKRLKMYIYKSTCPNCKRKNENIGSFKDTGLLEAALELFWTCPNDFGALKIIKRKDRMLFDGIDLQLQCSTCKKKYKKYISNAAAGDVLKNEGKKSDNLIKEHKSNFIKYNFTENLVLEDIDLDLDSLISKINEVKICSNCGEDISDDSNFCSKCGNLTE